MNGSVNQVQPARTPAVLRPRVFFPLLVALVIVSVLLTPHQESGEARLTVRSPGPLGASALADVASALGWTVSEIETPLTSAAFDAASIYAVLVPAGALTAMETHTLLEHVRRGGAAIVLLGGGALRDSLNLDAGGRLGSLVRGADSTSCPETTRSIRALATRSPLVANGVETIGPMRGDTTHLAVVRRPTARRSATAATVVGIQLGRGRIAAVADGSMLANDVLRVCRWGAGVAVVRTFEWLAEAGDGPKRTRIVFDEWHHGAGEHPSVIRAIAGWFTGTPSGRVALQLVVAGLLLVLALGPRPIAPVGRTRFVRRSPLEHVGALAAAYERVHGTRTAVRLLVKGIRRRTARAPGARSLSDEDYLSLIANRVPALNDDIALVHRGLSAQASEPELVGMANAIDRIERSLT